MAMSLIRLRWQLLINQLRRSTVVLVFSILAGLYVLGLLIGFVVAMALIGASAAMDPAQQGAVLTIIGAVIVFCWLIFPLFISGTSPMLDIRNFMVYGMPRKSLLQGFFFGSVLSPAGIGTAVVLLAMGLAWMKHPLALMATPVMALLGVSVCVLVSHLATTALNKAFSKRGVREIVQILLLLPLMLSGLLIVGAVETVADLWEMLPKIGSVIAMTPLGITALPGLVASGQWGIAGLNLVVFLATIAVLIWAWYLAMRRAEDQASVGASSSGKILAAGGIGKATTPSSAIRARALLYWRKDPRYSATLMVIPGLVILSFVLGNTEGFGIFGIMLPPFIAFLLGFAISADISYDASAFHLHVVSGVKGMDDRWGRASALLLWAAPAVLVLVLMTAWRTDSWEWLAPLTGVSLATLLLATGVSAVTSVRFIYPVPPPGASPFSTPSGGLAAILIGQGISTVISAVVAAPVIGLAVFAMVTESTVLGWSTLAAGLVYGALLLWVGIRVGASWFDRSADRAYQSVLNSIPEG